jgi:iron complex outermembrane receptor protein
MKKKNLSELKVVITLFLSVIAFTTFAQNLTLTGTVTDSNRGPIIGAAVVVQGSVNQGTVTNFEGKFVLTNVPSNGTIHVSYVGMQPQDLSVGGRTNIDIILQEDSKVLGEVVVTALGVPKQARSVGYATSKISPAEIERTNAINPVTALQGKVAGVSINIGGASGVTSSSSITIRGAKSIDKNNSPIFVVDGMIIQ